MRCQHLVHLVDKGADAGGMDVPTLHVHTVMCTLHPVGQTDCRVLRFQVSLQLHLCCSLDSSCCVRASAAHAAGLKLANGRMSRQD